jgi:hypothetical protein
MGSIEMRSKLPRQFRSTETIYSYRIGIVVGLSDSGIGLHESEKAIGSKCIANPVDQSSQSNGTNTTHLIEEWITINIRTMNTTKVFKQSIL